MTASIAGSVTGTIATATVRPNDDTDGVLLSPSDAAQQLSASACVTTRPNVESVESDLCIGQATPSTQQAIRASLVACQPEHSAR